MKKTIGYIYLITNTLNNKVYVGQHVFYQKRLDNSYFCSTTNPHFWNSIRKYENIDIKNDIALRDYCCRNSNRLKNFSKQLIQFAYSKSALDILEIMWIKIYRTRLGEDNVYNIADGGQSWNHVHRINMQRYGNKAGVTKEHLQKMLKAKDDLGILHDNSHMMTEEIIAKAMQIKRSKYGVGNTNCNSPEAIAKRQELFVYLKDSIYCVHPKNYRGWKKEGFTRVCKLEEWEQYKNANNIVFDLRH